MCRQFYFSINDSFLCRLGDFEVGLCYVVLLEHDFYSIPFKMMLGSATFTPSGTFWVRAWRDLHMMLFSVCELDENQRREGRTLLMGISD